jgi:mannose-6-phosphate isomerase-like protein (cupin superfamily)
MSSTLIKKSNARIVDLGTKVIRKYTAPDKLLEVNRMTLTGRNPENPHHFIFETKVHFMVYVVKGRGKIYCNDEVYEVEVEDVVDVPVNTRFAAEGTDFEYLTIEAPAWFPEQAFIVDKDSKVIEQSKK